MATGKLWMAPALAILITGCSTNELPGPRHAQPSGRIQVYNEVATEQRASALNAIMPAAGGIVNTGMAYKAEQRPADCSMRDRFDRNSTVAYNFSDGKSRLGLHVDIDGPSLSDPGAFEVEGVMLNFRYRFQPIAKKRENCLYKSSWQGLLGSGYNEFFERETDTVYEQFDDELDHFFDEFDQHF